MGPQNYFRSPFEKDRLRRSNGPARSYARFARSGFRVPGRPTDFPSAEPTGPRRGQNGALPVVAGSWPLRAMSRGAATSRAGRSSMITTGAAIPKDAIRPRFHPAEIPSGPVLVAAWINLQYHGAIVAPDAFGGGNKLFQNVAGATGKLRGGPSNQGLAFGDRGRARTAAIGSAGGRFEIDTCRHSGGAPCKSRIGRGGMDRCRGHWRGRSWGPSCRSRRG